MKLLNLEIKSFRGATQPVKIEFDPQKKITMVFGENGNGKSTISDAFVCLLSEESGSLDDRSSSTDKKKYLASAECNMKDVLIKLNTDEGTFAADFLGAGKEWNKVPPTGHPTIRQLRRSHITKLIDAQPAKRYEELRNYIDVSKIETAENVLSGLAKEIAGDLKLQVGVLTSAQTTLEEQWRGESSPGKDYMEWAAAEKAKDLTLEEKTKEVINLVQTAWSSVTSAVNEVVEKSKLSVKAKEEFEKAAKLLMNAQEGEQVSQQSLITLLQKTVDYLALEHSVKSCPVCNQAVEKEPLLASVSQRLVDMSNISGLMADKESKQRLADNAQAILENAYERMDNALAAFSKSIFGCPISLDVKLTDAASKLNSSDTHSRKQAYKTYGTDISNCIAQLEQRLAAAERTLQQYNLIVKQYDIILANEAKSKETEQLLVKTKATLEVVSNTRKKFVENELNSIAGEVDRIYKVLHPNEEIGGVKLSLKSGLNAKASLELSADFHTQKAINPQSLYSESHLDTLGICIFLALANKYNNGKTIVILDDVVMSVDHNHLDRFIDLVNQEAKHFTHVLLTTHYRPWKDRYRHHRAGSSHIHFIELKPWSLKGGIRTQSFKMDYDDLKHTVENADLDRQNVAAKSGIFLENMLDFLAIRFRCKLPHTADPRHTLGDYLSCFGKKLLPAMHVEHLVKDYTTGKFVEPEQIIKSPLKAVIDDLKNISFIRNEVGAHFNLDSQTGDTEVLNFGNLTLKLAGLLLCPESGSLPIREKSGSYHETPSGSIRLHPLKEPS